MYHFESAIPFFVMFFLFIITGLSFFSKGQRSLSWYLTLAPFIVSFLLLCTVLALSYSDLLTAQLAHLKISFIGIVMGCLAIFVFGTALGSHREPIPMWHQNKMLPRMVTKSGAYRFIRHPFYTAYYFYYIGIFLVLPSIPMLANSIFALVMLYLTAKKEEQQLLSSTGLSEEYREYMDVSGMFFPRMKHFN